MSFLSNLILNINSIVLLIIILIHSSRSIEKDTLQHMLFTIMLQVIILMLVVDIFSRFDGNPGTIHSAINWFGNFLIYLLNPVLPSLWLLYVHSQVFHEEKNLKPLLYSLLALNMANAVLLVLSQFFGWFYTIDTGNIYHRGPLFWLPASVTVLLILMSFVIVGVNRAKIEKKYYFPLLFFAVPPLICAVLQIVFYGISIVLNSLVISVLIVFLNIQNKSMNTDYLTGIYNRKKLEIYMKEKINASTADKTFSAILIDINNFKHINDTFGHDMGDDALETTVKLLKSCVEPTDFIARFGGDEFYIILDVSNRVDLGKSVRKMNQCIQTFNQSGSKPYNLSFSMGYAVYDYNSHMDIKEFQKQIDMLMYQNKRIFQGVLQSPQ